MDLQVVRFTRDEDLAAQVELNSSRAVLRAEHAPHWAMSGDRRRATDVDDLCQSGRRNGERHDYEEENGSLDQCVPPFRLHASGKEIGSARKRARKAA
jgi:hypothetical protein